jgi:hypothetical protein
VIVASGRLARGNPSVAIGVDMHLTALLNVVRRYRRIDSHPPRPFP